MTGAGIVIPEVDAAEVERRTISFAKETSAQGDIGQALARRAALCSVRMERLADQQTAALTERTRQVIADFVPPEGASPETASWLRKEAVRKAMCDVSKEATLARKYEAAAERSFLRCLKELRQMERQAQRGDHGSPFGPMGPMGPGLGSFFHDPDADDQVDAIYDLLKLPRPNRPVRNSPKPPVSGGVDVPFAVGRRS